MTMTVYMYTLDIYTNTYIYIYIIYVYKYTYIWISSGGCQLLVWFSSTKLKLDFEFQLSSIVAID
jgi:hypothetical protein